MHKFAAGAAGRCPSARRAKWPRPWALLDVQQQALAAQRAALNLQRQEFAMARAQFDRAERLQGRAEQLQERSAALVTIARRTLVVVLPVVFGLIVYLFWLIFR